MGKKEYSIEECDVFDFMTNVVGLTVLHPGGLQATDRLAQLCDIHKDTRVLDIACGKGRSTIYLAQKYGCEIEGIDMDEDLIAQANELAKRKGLQGQVKFRVGDALNLPYRDDEFDVSLSQAFLILIVDKRKAIQETLRVTKPGGYVGWLELSLKREPSPEFFDRAALTACAFCVQNALTFDGWQALFHEAGVRDPKVIMDEMGRHSMLREEGLLNTVRVMSKWLSNPKIRKRMRAVRRFFNDNAELIGYGIFVGRK